MKTHTKYLTFNTKQRRELLHITPQVAEAVRESGFREGFVLVSAMHITTGQLDLSTWQRIFYTEFDGQRPRRVIIKAMGNKHVTARLIGKRPSADGRLPILKDANQQSAAWPI